MTADLAAALAGIRDRHGPVRNSADPVPALLAAVDAVLALHVPEPGQHPGYCGHDQHELPCPTIDAITAALTPPAGEAK